MTFIGVVTIFTFHLVYMVKKAHKLIPREISWLAFNERVLQEAADPTVPLIERLKFLGIFSNNLDEFFRVRVATLKRMEEFGRSAKEIMGISPTSLLKQIHRKVLVHQTRYEAIHAALIDALGKEKIHLIDETHLSREQGEFVKKYFREEVLPKLVPVMISNTPVFPYLKDRAIYFAIKLFSPVKGGKHFYSMIEIPTSNTPRFVLLPKIKEQRYIIMLDDVIRYCLNDVFSIFEFDHAEAFVVKLTRDSELDIDTDFFKPLAEKIARSVKQRKKGKPVSLAYDRTIPKDLLHFILNKVKADKSIQHLPGGRYQNLNDFLNFPDAGRHDLLYPPQKPLQHPELASATSVLDVVRRNDILLSFPYQTFSHVIDMLRESSIDPDVISIKITLYRVAADSNVVRALTNAIKNGKAVTVVVELQARFDEEANIYWARQLQEEGATVIFGVPGLKVHSKLVLITRKDDHKQVDYALIGTGNFSEQTAGVYTDHSVITCDKRITGEVSKLFNFYANNFKTGHYKQLIVSPFSMRKKFIKLIQKEIDNARSGHPAFITLKLNNLTDAEIVNKLYIAAAAGVEVNLIVRSSCAISQSKAKAHQNIHAISIVDKYLEHARILAFCNKGDIKVYLSSADWMPRNFDQRSEVALPVLDKKIKNELLDILDLQMKDNVKARILDPEMLNTFVQKSRGQLRHRAQVSIYKHFEQVLQV